MEGQINALQQEYDNLLRCIRCAACLTSCPTYVTTHKEEEGPRGRIAIMRALVEGHLDLTPDAVEHLDNCLLCDACSHICPSGVEMERLGTAFREFKIQNSEFKKRGLAERFAFGWLFGELGHFRTAARLVRFYQRSGLQWLARCLGILKLLGVSEMERLLPPVPGSFVVPKGQRVGAGDPAQVFAGCIMSTAFAPTTERTVELLAAFGCENSFPQGQVCCGALQLHAGEADRARQLARANIRAFDGEAPIVVNAAGCGAMLKHYGQLLPDEPAAQAFADRVRDVSELLTCRQPCSPPRPLERTVVLQDACHLLHAQGIVQAPRKLLKAIPGLGLREMAEPGLCCGSAGIYNVTHQATSAELQRRKRASILATGAQTVVTTNPGCLLQIRAGLPAGIEVRHIVDVLWEAYGPLTRDRGGRSA
ncbi:MAG TPA: (Fe-S)-binding protein [Chloroflexota bacterium]|nr:(Fe-S)-binding protein [Chloroflexota bacterium]